MKHPESSQISQSFGRSFAQMLRGMLQCDCSQAQCHNEVTRMQCEAQQGLFVDKLLVRQRCQCCDRCYVPRGHYQKCQSSQVKNVQYVCDYGLYCSPFTHMCIEKREIFSQFLMKVEKENKYKELGLFDEEQPSHEQNVFLVRKKREEDEEDKNVQAPAPEGGDEEDHNLQKGHEEEKKDKKHKDKKGDKHDKKGDKHEKEEKHGKKDKKDKHGKKDKKHKEESEDEHKEEGEGEKEHKEEGGEEEEHHSTTTTKKPKKGKKGR